VIERIGFARRLVATSDRAFSFATAEGRVADILRTRLAPLLIPQLFSLGAARWYLFRTVSQITLNYRGGPLSVGTAGHVYGGDRLPWVAEPHNVRAEAAHSPADGALVMKTQVLPPGVHALAIRAARLPEFAVHVDDAGFAPQRQISVARQLRPFEVVQNAGIVAFLVRQRDNAI
jgi:hypothetical protein